MNVMDFFVGSILLLVGTTAFCAYMALRVIVPHSARHWLYGLVAVVFVTALAGAFITGISLGLRDPLGIATAVTVCTVTMAAMFGKRLKKGATA